MARLRWPLPRLTLAGAALATVLQWRSTGVRGEAGAIATRGSVHDGGALGGGIGVAPSAQPAEPSAGIRPWPRQRHLRSLSASSSPGAGAAAVPAEREWSSRSSSQVPAGALPGGTGAAAAAVQGRRYLSDVEAYVDSSEPCAGRMEVAASKCDFRNRQTLEWGYGEGDSSTTCETALPEPTTIKCDHVAWGSGEGIAIGILAGAGMAVSLFFWVALSRYGKSRTVRLGQPALCKTFIVGICITCLSALALVGASGDLSCALGLWGYSAGFDLAFGAVALKLWCALSAAESSRKFTRVRLTTRKVLAMLLVIIAADVVVLARWTATFGDNCDANYEAVGGGAGGGVLAYVRRDSCVSCSHALFWSWVGLKVVLVLLCCYVSLRARKARAQSAVSDNSCVFRGIGMAVYNLAMAGLLVAAVVWADADAQVRRTTEAVAIVLGGVGALFSILAPKILRAKQELEGKALVGPSAMVTGPSGSGDALFGIGAGDQGLDFDGGGREGAHRTSTLSGVSSGGGGGGDSGSKNKRRGSGRRRRALSKGVSGGGNVGGIHIPASLMGGSNKSTHTISPEVDYEGGQSEIPPPLPPAETAAFAAATTAAALQDRNSFGSVGSGKGKRRHLLSQTKPKAPPAASVICSRPRPGVGGPGGGNFATTGGASGRKLILPDPSGFFTPPRRVRRARSSVELSMRSADTMAKAAAAAGAADRKGSGSVAAPAYGGDSRQSAATASKAKAKAKAAKGAPGGRKSVSRKSSGSHKKIDRGTGGGGSRGASAERRGGGSGSTTASAKPPLSGASGSSRASRASSRGRSSRSHSLSHHSTTNKTSHRSSAGTHRQGTSTSGGSVGGDSNSVLSRDSCSFDPFVMMLNGHFGMGGLRHPSAGAHSQKRKNSGGGGGGGGQRGSGKWSSSGRKRGTSSERPNSMGSSSAGEGRSSHPGSLVMYPHKGTTLHCPHCDLEVAGCGFKGCSGSLVRAPSDDEDFGRSDDDELYGPEEFVAPAQPPPLLPKLGPHIGGGDSYFSGVGGRGGGGAGGVGGPSSVSGSHHGNIMSPSAQTSASMLGGSIQAHMMATHTAAATALPPAHKNLSMGAASRLRMSFRRGPSPCDTFDNESDDDDDDDMDDDDGRHHEQDEGDESQRSNLGIYSPTSSSAWP